MTPSPHLRTLPAALGVTLLLAAAGASEAANECQVSYTFTSGSGPSAVPGVSQGQVSANSIENINQSHMRYVVNDRDWPVEVEVTTIGGGTKWVLLGKKGDRDPAHIDYVGDITLKKVKCLPGGTASSGAGPSGSNGAGMMTEMMLMMQMMQMMQQQQTREDAERKRVAAQEDLVLGIFKAVRNITVAHADQLQTWTAQAQAVAKRTVADFAGCPSSAAQVTYDDLKSKRAMTVSARDGAQAASTQAQQALASCLAQTGNSPSCSSTHAALTFSATHSSAVMALAAIDSALSAMRALQCLSPISNRSVPLVTNP
jgi:hypothetical protein